MANTPGKDQGVTVLPRSVKHYHVVVSEEVHGALKAYAAKHHLSLCSATVKLLKSGLRTEMDNARPLTSPGIDEFRRLIQELGERPAGLY